MASILHHIAATTLCLLVLTSSVSAEDTSAPAAVASIEPRMRADAALAKTPDAIAASSLMHVRISRKLLAPLFEREVTRHTEVNDQILDSLVIGTSKTVGEIRLEMVRSSDHAVFDVIFTGESVATANGMNEWVVAPNVTHTTLSGRTRIVYDGNKLKALPSRARARSKVKVAQVIPRPKGRFRSRVPKGIIERAGWRQIRRTLARREQIGAQLAVARLQRYLDREIAEELAKAEFPRHLVNALQNVGLSSRNVKVSSTADALHLAVQMPDTESIKALDSLTVLDGDADIVVSVHQSAIDRLGHTLLSGAILNQSGLSRDGRQLFGQNGFPAQLQLTMDRKQPIGVRFANGLLDLTLMSSQCEMVQTALPGFGVHLRCRLEPTDEGLRTELVGQPRVTPSSPLNWSLAMIPLKQMVERALASQLSGRTLKRSVLQIKKLGEPALRPAFARSEDGWLTLAWSRLAATPVDALVADKANP